MIDMMLEGAAELEKTLLRLEKKTAKKVVRKAVRAGAKPTLTTAKNNAASMVGGKMGALIKKNIVIKAYKKQRSGSFALAVRMRSGVAEFIHITADGERYYIPMAIEYGHALPGAGGSKSKDVVAVPFMRNAIGIGIPQAKRIIKNEIVKGINQLAKT
tara:strand:- start:1662 stop:2135 length:474 start_codon:yes stop_codon:yes gene_type:complete